MKKIIGESVQSKAKTIARVLLGLSAYELPDGYEPVVLTTPDEWRAVHERTRAFLRAKGHSEAEALRMVPERRYDDLLTRSGPSVATFERSTPLGDALAFALALGYVAVFLAAETPLMNATASDLGHDASMCVDTSRPADAVIAHVPAARPMKLNVDRIRSWASPSTKVSTPITVDAFFGRGARPSRPSRRPVRRARVAVRRVSVRTPRRARVSRVSRIASTAGSGSSDPPPRSRRHAPVGSFASGVRS